MGAGVVGDRVDLDIGFVSDACAAEQAGGTVGAFLRVQKDLSTLISAHDYPGTTIAFDRTVTVLVQTSPGIYEPANVNLVTGAYAVIATGVTGTLPALPVAS
jgi:hypothetical protein